MIKLATVFSGIGAIEHALDRMGLDYEIVFACDNGDVDILNKEIKLNIDEIENELIFLDTTVKEAQLSSNVEDLYKQQLYGMLTEAHSEFRILCGQLSKVPQNKTPVSNLLEAILAMPGLKKSREKEYAQFLLDLPLNSDNQRKLKEFQVILKIFNDFKKDNPVADLDTDVELKSVDGIKWRKVASEVKSMFEFLEQYNGKKIIRKIQDLSQRASQLHEKLNYMKIQRELGEFGNDWNARKAYVDKLYAGLESRNKVKQSYMANYKINDEDFHWNVAFINGKQYEGKVDLFVGGSPCQSFSLVGKQRGLDDTRGTLFYEYARLIDEIKPKLFIYENVRAVTSHDGGKTWQTMQNVFSELGYDFYFDVLNAKNYGIPQNRERLFVIGFRKDLAPTEGITLPEPIPLALTMKDFLVNNAPGGYFLPKKGVDFVTREGNLIKRYTQIDGDVQLCQKKNQQFNWHGDFVFQSEEDAETHHILDLEKYYLSEKVKKYVLATGTKGFYSKPAIDLDIARPLLTSMHKMHRAGVDNYVTTEGRLRKLTPRECLRLMGFSDTFKIVVSDTSMYQQAGNSIVVDVLIAILRNINIERYGDAK